MTHNEFIRNPHLEGEEFLWAGNRTGILLIHGFTATTAEVRLLAKKLHEAGYTTAAPLLPGHGTHPDDLHRTTWRQWVDKVGQTYQELAARCDHIVVGGVSTGGVLALELVSHQPDVAGVILFAPAIKINGIWLARLLSPFIKHIKKSYQDDERPWKGYNVYPVKGLAELHKLQKHVQSRLPSITRPLVVFTGEYDQFVTPDTAQIILQGVSSEIKQHFHMGASDHWILLDRELDQIAEHVLAFIVTVTV